MNATRIWQDDFEQLIKNLDSARTNYPQWMATQDSEYGKMDGEAVDERKLKVDSDVGVALPINRTLGTLYLMRGTLDEGIKVCGVGRGAVGLLNVSRSDIKAVYRRLCAPVRPLMEKMRAIISSILSSSNLQGFLRSVGSIKSAERNLYAENIAAADRAQRWLDIYDAARAETCVNQPNFISVQGSICVVEGERILSEPGKEFILDRDLDKESHNLALNREFLIHFKSNYSNNARLEYKILDIISELAKDWKRFGENNMGINGAEFERPDFPNLPIYNPSRLSPPATDPNIRLQNEFDRELALQESARNEQQNQVKAQLERMAAQHQALVHENNLRLKKLIVMNEALTKRRLEESVYREVKLNPLAIRNYELSAEERAQAITQIKGFIRSRDFSSANTKADLIFSRKNYEAIKEDADVLFPTYQEGILQLASISPESPPSPFDQFHPKTQWSRPVGQIIRRVINNYQVGWRLNGFLFDRHHSYPVYLVGMALLTQADSHFEEGRISLGLFESAVASGLIDFASMSTIESMERAIGPKLKSLGLINDLDTKFQMDPKIRPNFEDLFSTDVQGATTEVINYGIEIYNRTKEIARHSFSKEFAEIRRLSYELLLFTPLIDGYLKKVLSTQFPKWINYSPKQKEKQLAKLFPDIINAVYTGQITTPTTRKERTQKTQKGKAKGKHSQAGPGISPVLGLDALSVTFKEWYEGDLRDIILSQMDRIAAELASSRTDSLAETNSKGQTKKAKARH